jgi:multisubunit Na+/H+ antiporter MnhG subunit
VDAALGYGEVDPNGKASTMGIGLGIVLLVIGAILAFAVDYTMAGGIEITTVGYILMAAGVLALILGLVMNTQRTNTTHREVVDRHTDADVRRRDIEG